MFHIHHDHNVQPIRCFDRDAAAAGSLAQHYAGIHTIPLAAIVGSVGRSQNLRSDFLPLHESSGGLRYHAVVTAMKHGAALPAIEVYRLADRYYILDGHHRVAAARALGQLYIEAIVTDYCPCSDTSWLVAA